MKKYAILLILLLAVLLRSINIGSVTIGVHQWRQSQTAMVAKNFHENGFNFLQPQIDWVGGTEAAETDFPVYSYLMALGGAVFGFHDWVGRAISIAFALVTVFFVYLLARRLIDEATGLWAAFFLAALPLFSFYGRAVMPESMMLASTVLGVYFFSRWLEAENGVYFLASLVFISIACLLKPTSLYIGLPLLYLAWMKHGKTVVARPMLWAYTAILFSTVFAWYYHAHNIYLQTGNTIGLYDKMFNWELLATPKFWNRIVVQRLLEKHFAWTGFMILIAGLSMKRRTGGERLFDFWFLAAVIYILIAAKGNMAHEYYQLPIIIPAAVIMGKVYSRHFELNNPRTGKFAALALGLLAFVVFSGIRHYKHIVREERPEVSPSYRLSEKVRELTEKDSLVVTVTDGDPTILYLSKRKGWVSNPDNVGEPVFDSLVQQGAGYVAGVYWRFDRPDEKERLEWLLRSGKYRVVFDDGDIFIVKLA